MLTHVRTYVRRLYVFKFVVIRLFLIQEAAIYLQEGVENEKLFHHPTDVKSYWAYMVIHQPAYYLSEFAVCVLLMLLALLEEPTFFDVPIQVRRLSTVCMYVRILIMLTYFPTLPATCLHTNALYVIFVYV